MELTINTKLITKSAIRHMCLAILGKGLLLSQMSAMRELIILGSTSPHGTQHSKAITRKKASLESRRSPEKKRCNHEVRIRTWL